MKKIYLVLLIFVISISNAQVGINTSTPAKSLDVNGTLNVRREIRTGGTTATVGAAGSAGQLFGVVNATSDTWKTVQIANGTGSLSFFYLNTVKDNVGVQFTQTGNTGIYNIDAPYNATNWAYIPNATDSFVVTKTDNLSKAILSFQTTVQLTRGAGTNWASGFASYSCGIFVEKDGAAGQLKAVRNDIIRGAPGAYRVYNLNVVLDGLSAGSYVVKAACTNRNLGTGTTLTHIGIGRPVDTTTLNTDMSQSTLTTSLLQTY
ncbi:hypothetical protein EGH90_07555 [Kaistella haifensis]|nr:hypothetical protein EGH90_07555 [Kaistella haifensis]